MITLDVQPQGERFTFFGEPDPAAPIVEFELVGAPGTPGPDPHIHPKQVETFRVTSGEMVARLGKEERVIRITELSRLAIANGGRWKDVPLLEAAYILHLTRDEHGIPGMPRFLQHALFAPLAGLAVLLGKHRKIGPRPAAPRGAPSPSRAPSPEEAA